MKSVVSTRPNRRPGTARAVSLGIMLSVAVTVVGWHLLIAVSRPAHLKQIAAETGSLGDFIGGPKVAEDGSRISFFRGTTHGDGLFVCELATGRQKLLYEDEGIRRHQQFGWSPDGGLLAFSGINNGRESLIICDGTDGRIETAIPLYGPLNEFAWLSPDSFVFLKGGTMAAETQKGGLMRVDRRGESDWTKPYHFTAELPAGSIGPEKPEYLPIKGVMAVSSDTVAWVARNAIWEWVSGASTPERVWRGYGKYRNIILECRYSREVGKYLLHLQNTNGNFAASYRSGAKQPVILDRIEDAAATNLLWINGGKGYAFLLNESVAHVIFARADCSGSNVVQKLPQDGVRTIVAGGKCIYGIGSLEGQPHGVIEYDVSSHLAQYVVSSLAHFIYAQNVVPSAGIITNSLGEIHAYSLWSPVRLDARKKYPLVICQQMRLWDEYAEAAANAGAYYLSVTRPDFNSPQIEHWIEDVIAARRLMCLDGNIDTNRIYLCGASEETEFIARLLDQEPGLWGGAILNSPTAFPDAAKIGAARILISCGESDEYNVFDKVRSYQEQAAHNGAAVTVVTHRSGHVFISAEANRESTQEFVEFLFE